MILPVLFSVLILGCGDRVERQTHAVDIQQVSWSDGDEGQEDALTDLFQAGEEQLVIDFDVSSSGDDETITLWQGTASADGTTMDEALGSSTEGWVGDFTGDGTFYFYSIYLPVDSIELGGITLLTPSGVWLTGDREGSVITGDLRFDEPEDWGGWGSIAADLLVDALFATWNESSTIEVDEPVDISGISFRIDYQLDLIESE